MIGVVIVTHGRLAEEFVAAAEHVFERKLKAMKPVCIGPDDDMEMRRKEIIATVKACDDGSGVVILTDMFGGTPSNLAISIMGSGKIEVIAGVNLPMLIKLAEVREKMGLNEAVHAAQEAARKYIAVASSMLQRAE